MDIRVSLRYYRQSPRKVRLVADLLRKLPVAAARQQLTFANKDAAGPLLKLLNSAVANAEHNHKLDGETLRVKSITVDPGPVLKRFRPRAFGRAAEIKKKTSHVVLTLTDEVATARVSKRVSEIEKSNSKAATVTSKKN